MPLSLPPCGSPVLGSCRPHTEYKTLEIPKIHSKYRNTDKNTQFSETIPNLCDLSLFQEPRKGGFSERGFRRNSQIFIAPLCMYICTATWHPMCPLATSPCLSTLLVLSEFNLLFQGLSRLLAASALQNYLQGCRAQVQDSLRQK